MTTKKKSTKKASKAEAAPKEEVQPDAPAVATAVATERSLAAGTVVRFPGSDVDMTLKGDAAVTFAEVGNDAKFAGMLAAHGARHKENFDLNIGQLEGTWNPVTARREE